MPKVYYKCKDCGEKFKRVYQERTCFECKQKNLKIFQENKESLQIRELKKAIKKLRYKVKRYKRLKKKKVGEKFAIQGYKARKQGDEIEDLIKQRLPNSFLTRGFDIYWRGVKVEVRSTSKKSKVFSINCQVKDGQVLVFYNKNYPKMCWVIPAYLISNNKSITLSPGIKKWRLFETKLKNIPKAMKLFLY